MYERHSNDYHKHIHYHLDTKWLSVAIVIVAILGFVYLRGF